jgi:hypothetical protein
VSKNLRLVLMVALVVVVVAAGVMVGCGKSKEKTLQQVSMTLSQYLRGATGDLDDATINSAAEGAGDGAVNSMFMAMTLPTLTKGTQYTDLTPAQQDAVQAAEAAFFDSVQSSIDNGTALDQNPAYTTLKDLQALTWMGLWADSFVGFNCVDAFWKVLPDPAGRGSKVEYLDKQAEAAYGKTYAQITDAQRATLDAELAALLAQMQTDVAAAQAASVAAGTAEISKPEHADAFAAAMAAYFAVLGEGGTTAEAEAAFTKELMTNWPADYAAMAGAGQAAMMYGYAGPPVFGGLVGTDEWAVLEGPAVALNGIAAAEGWKTDVTAGVHPVQAFKRWMVKPALVGLEGLGLLVQVCVAEFDVVIDNPNDYDVSIDSINMDVSNNSNGFGYYPAIDVDAAKLALGDAVWVPAKGSIDLHLVVPIKTLDMLTWLIVGPGLDQTTAGTYAADVWAKLKAGTAVWNVTIVTSQTSPKGQNIPDATYTMTWTPAAS